MTRPTLHQSVTALSIAAFAFAFCGLRALADDAAKLPVYRLEVGQELTYKADSELKNGEGKKQTRVQSHIDWKASVVGKNKDGSYRVVVRSARTSSYNGKPSGKAHATMAYFDIFDDGRTLPNPTLGFSVDPSILFPRLPSNSKEVADGWESLREVDASRNLYKVQSQPKSPKGAWTIAVERKDPLDEIYLITHKSSVTYDPTRGLATKSQGESSQGWGAKGKGTNTLALVSVDKHDADWAKKLWTNAARYFDSQRDYEAKCELAGKDDKNSKKLLDEAKSILATAEKEVSLPLLKEQLKDSLKSHDMMAKFTIEEAKNRAKVIGHPVAEIEAADLKGKKHTLKDYKGKVVVLDFWYRGCSWCMRAMPQMKQLAAEFRGEPVAVIGMNTDRVEADAKFVVDKFGLDYTTLKVDHAAAKKFGVQGFPTLVIVDRQGNVHDLHVGYSPTMQRDVAEVVRQLLSKR
jgi:thiol-disulfide isomerase/thioredoxin